MDDTPRFGLVRGKYAAQKQTVQKCRLMAPWLPERKDRRRQKAGCMQPLVTASLSQGYITVKTAGDAVIAPKTAVPLGQGERFFC
ncbi:hypothetical protein [Pontibacter indicus]|uniref:hypothetical protein n=1 Tax=Pontibacter indicus TaxID=1317125 RepID=UPI001480872B|nr:hypothetical protein [Pontibacter indicus]